MMGDYPCGVCRNECDTDTIQCSECEKWFHQNCLAMSRTELKSWSLKSLNFFCASCAFDDELYDARKALTRLKSALEQKKKSALYDVAKNEIKLLTFHNVSIPSIEVTNSIHSQDIDLVSMDILKLYHPAMLTSNVALNVSGDGNCLYRALSKSLSGSEKFHILLRLETALELIIFSDRYNAKGKKPLEFLLDTRIITSDISKLIDDCLSLGSYSEMAHIYAASASLKTPIRSYYPPQSYPELSSEPFTRTVLGRDVKFTHTDVCIMWTSMEVPCVMNNFRPNHFVPLIKKNQACSEKEIINVESSPPKSLWDAAAQGVSDFEKCNDIKSNDKNMTSPQTDFFCSNSSVSFDCSSVESVSVLAEVSHAESNDLETTSVNLTTDDSESDENPARGVLDSGAFLPLNKTVDLLLKSENSFDHIPGGKKENVYFIISNDTNMKNRSHKTRSNFSDDCGAWNTATGCTPKSHYLLTDNGELQSIYFYKGAFCHLSRVKNANGKTERKYVPLNPQPEKNQVVVVHRYYTSLNADPQYKKRVTWLGDGGLTSNLAIAEYVGSFPGLVAHGNSKDSTSEYLRTPAYVLSDVREMLKTEKPKMVFEKLKNKYDEVTRPTGLQQIRDKKKNENAKKGPYIHRKNVADNIQELENMVTHKHSFVRSVIRTTAKTPFTILYSDEQLTDIKNLCCTGRTILGVDKTFNLCDMHVTVTCYKQLSVHRMTTEEPPIFIGPIFLHDNSDFESYCQFFHHLKMKLVDTNLTKLVIGSDDESAMVKAIMTAFPESTHVLCTRHLYQNTNQKLLDDAVDKTGRNTILNKIFGNDGIVNADDTICFDEKCNELAEHCEKVSNKFVQYFQSRLKKNLKSKVSEPVRKDLVSKEWTNNNCESMNHVLKQAIDWKSKSLTELVTILQELVDGQFKDLRSALLSTGEFRLAEDYLQFQVTKTDWISKTADQKNKLYAKFRKFVPADSRILTSTDGQTDIIAPRTHGKKPGQRKRKINERTQTTKKIKAEK